MKTPIIAAVAAISSGLALFATPTTDNYHSVTNDWYNGNYSNVLELANLRLAANSNDMVAVHLKVEYAMGFGSITDISNEVSRMMAVCDAATAPAYTNMYQKVRPGWVYFMNERLPAYTAEQIAEEHQKASQPHQKMMMELPLRILDEAGLW